MVVNNVSIKESLFHYSRTTTRYLYPPSVWHPPQPHGTQQRHLTTQNLFLQALFHKQSAEDAEARQNKVKLSNIVVECRKEGLVQYLTPESLDQPSGPQKWEKCKLALVKTVGGYMLEFYSPPKSQMVSPPVVGLLQVCEYNNLINHPNKAEFTEN